MNEQNEQEPPMHEAARTVPVREQVSTKGVRHALPWLILVFSLLITWLAWRDAMLTVNLAKEEYFDFRVREAITRIQQRMEAYQQVLLGVLGLYESSASVERREFKTYVKGLALKDHYPGIQGIGFSLIVPAADKNVHIAALRNEGFPEYTIHPEGVRDPYTSIVYLEPFEGRNLHAFGYDMYSESVRRRAMDDARDNGRMALSGKVRLVQEEGDHEQAGFLLYVPVYRNDAPHDTMAERRANIIGWAYSPFRMNDLMQGIHGEHASDLDIEIYDSSETNVETLMYDSDASGTASLSAQTPLHSRTVVEIAGHQWTIHIRALQGIHSRVDSQRSDLVAAAGLAISVLLTWLTWSLVTGREQAISAVREREKLIAELQKAFAEIKTLQGILPICSVCKKIRDDKDAWKQMETFISEHSDVRFTHGYCPDCAKKAMEALKALPK